MIGANRAYQNDRIAADRLFDIMDLDGTDEEEKLKMTQEDVGDIRLEKVKFRYGTRVNVFEDFYLTLRQGQLTAIIGESGSGKSTIAAILKRLYPVEEGMVTIGNYNIDTLREDSINELIGIVPQQIDLFAGSVLENIALGDFQPDTQRVMQLAEEVGALDFINEIEGGLAGQLGENGLNLSGGQRQRLAILRALYPNPEIIIFDEATSVLDNKSEELIIRTMLRLRDQGKTVIAITHRMAAAKAADEVVLLHKGKIVCQGTHHKLLTSEKAYGEFWASTKQVPDPLVD